MMQEQFFIGKKPVAQMVDTGKKTPMGGIILKIVFEDGRYEYMPEKRFNLIKTTTQSDETYVRSMLVTHVSKDIGSVAYSMLLEFGCRLSEIDVITNQVAAMTNAGSERVNNLLWGVDYADERTLNQINDILIEHVAKEQNSNGTASSGAGTDTPDTK
jgi:hypothetical protein